jgi:CheY-like chemotaxis protein
MIAAVANQAQRLSFETAEALVFDPVPGNRATARTALGMLGFQQVTATSVLEELTPLVRDRCFDVIFADVTQEPVRACDVVRCVREGGLGPNPFVHIVLMAWRLEGDLVQRALNCGADDLITRPFSVDFLRARLRTHAEARKSFVVTWDYIGPDRRRARPQQPPSNLFEVPNLLLAKAQDPRWTDRAAKQAQDSIKQTYAKINGERARADAFQIAFRVHALRDALKAVAPLDNDLAKVEAVAKDLGTRVEGSPLEEEILKQISALLASVSAAKSGENVAAHIEEMDAIATTSLTTLNPERQRDDLLRDVAAAYAAFKARGRKS